MEIVHLPDLTSRPLQPLCIVDEGNQTSNNKRRNRQRGKLRKCGFDKHDLSREHMIKLNEEGFAPIEQAQLENVNVEWQMGKNGPILEPLSSFDDLEIDDKIRLLMKMSNFRRPLPIQRYVIPYILNTNADMLIQAQTGSGKTLAFLLPIIQEIFELKRDNNQSPNSKSPYAVIVAPVCELVKQLASDANKLCHGISAVRIAYAHGELDMRDSKKMLDNGCDLLFTTAGRLHHYFNEEDPTRGAMLLTNNIRYVILDEADRLLENKRGIYRKPSKNNNKGDELPDSGEIVKTFVDRLTHDRNGIGFRVFMFSATYDEMNLVRELLVWDNCLKITVGSNIPVETVSQSIIEVKRTESKMTMLMDFLHLLAEDSGRPGKGGRKIGKTLIFVNCIRVTERLVASLIDDRFNALSINSERSGRQRNDAITKFRSGHIDILVATDVSSRGLNINELKYVINYDIPTNIALTELTHRVGRCGRIGNCGRAITFFDPNTDKHAVEMLKNILESSPSSSEDDNSYFF